MWHDPNLFRSADNDPECGGAPLSQKITRLLGTDDWAILHSGHEMVTAEDLDDLEAEVSFEHPTIQDAGSVSLDSVGYLRSQAAARIQAEADRKNGRME